MEQAGYTQADLARLLGSRSRASEILAGRRRLTMEQARRLHEAWHIPAEALIQPATATNLS
jgi:HTH-type transcriptional regulator / antitoxin HigA